MRFRKFAPWLSIAMIASGPAMIPAGAQTLDKVSFGTNWVAEAEHGGFYQALASGEYARRGLDVKIIQGGPGVNVPQLMAASAVDMGIGSNAYIVANLALAVHIFHGAWSLFASLGVSNPRLVRFRRGFAVGFAALILLGNISFPIMVQAKVIS